MKTYIFGLLRTARLRSTYSALRHLDDHMLADIGLSRSDITALMAGRQTGRGQRLNHE